MVRSGARCHRSPGAVKVGFPARGSDKVLGRLQAPGLGKAQGRLPLEPESSRLSCRDPAPPTRRPAARSPRLPGPPPPASVASMGRLARVVAALLEASVAAASVVEASRGRVGLAAVCAAAWAVAAAVPRWARRRGAPFGDGLRLLWLCPFALGWGLGEGLGLFGRFPWWDVLAHVAGGTAAAALLLARVARRRGVGRGSLLALALLAAAVAGGLWEAGEWASDRALGTQTQGGGADTLGDLAADLAGGALAGLAHVAGARGRRHAGTPAVLTVARSPSASRSPGA